MHELTPDKRLAATKDIWGADSIQYKAECLRHQGLTYRQIAEKLNCSVGHAFYAANPWNEFELRKRERIKYQKKKEELKNHVWEKLQDSNGLSLEEVAAICDAPIKLVNQIWYSSYLGSLMLDASRNGPR